MNRRADKKEFIAGIFNYCDRWCERCAFTDRCLNYASSKAMNEAMAKGLSDEEMSDKMDKFYEEQFPMEEDPLKAFSNNEEEDEMDFDVPEMTEEEVKEYDRIQKRKQKEMDENPLAKSSEEYLDVTLNWLKENEKLYEHGEGSLNTSSNLEATISDSLEVTDAVEIISWYHMQIHVKLMRAISGNLNDEREGNDSGYPKDSDGSCKVSLIGCDNSINAWKIMQKRFPEKKILFARFIARLQKIIKHAEEQFPKARIFKRAGFDD